MKTTRLFMIFALAVLLSSNASVPYSTVVAQAPQMSEEKTALYTKYYENRKGSDEQQKVAYELAQEFLKKFGGDDDQYVKAVHSFVAKYEANERLFNFNKAFDAKDFARTFDVGRQILQKEPENLYVVIRLVQSAYLSAVSGNKSLNAEAISLARTGIQLIESNKATNPAPMASVDDARAFLHYNLGWFLQDTTPVETAASVLKAIQSSTLYKTEPTAYFLLGSAIFNGEYQQLYNEYKEKYAGKDESPEQKALLAKLNAVADRSVDAMARAVALATKPEQQAFRKQAMAELTEIYKDFHNKSDAGLNELIAGVLSKPLP